MQLSEHPPEPGGKERRSSPDPVQSIVEQMADGIVIAGLDGRIRFANPAAEMLFGRTAAQLKGADLGVPVAQGSTEIDIVRSPGEDITAELRAADIEWEGQPARLISLRDITDRKRADERAAQLQSERLARVEAEAASQAKSEFITTMSHEFLTPINAVIGYADLMDLGIAGPVTPEQHEQLDRLRESARHLLGLVNAVLDLAKVEAGELPVELGSHRATDALDAAVASTAPLAKNRGITLTACDPSAILYYGDETRVRQILVNLLDNAVKFTRPGGTVRVSCEMPSSPAGEATLIGPGPWVAVAVLDTGIGIPAERMAAIFDPFVQVQSGYTRPSDGSGLGLTISRKLARLMGGDLTASSEPGRGSAFTLWLRGSRAS